MRKCILLIMAVFVFVIYSMPVVVQAYTLTVTDFEQGEVVNLSSNGVTFPASTGEFTVTIQYDNGQFLLSENADRWFSAFCLEIEQLINVPDLVPAVDLLNPSTFAGGLEAAWLMENRGQYTPLALSPWEDTGLQLALWEVTIDYNNQPFDLNSGAFWTMESINSADGAKKAIDLAGMYLDRLRQYFDPTGLDELYRIVHHPDKQDLMIKLGGQDPSAIPEPGTFLLIGFGLLGILGIARKRSSSHLH